MSRFFNVDINCMINDHELSYQNANSNFIEKYNKLYNDVQKVHKQKVDESNSILQQISDLKNKIDDKSTKLRNIAEKVECEQHTLQTETNRLESIRNVCEHLVVEENDLINLIDETKIEQTEVYKDKRENIKKFKREINAFKTGVNMYEKFLKLSLTTENKETNSRICITMRNCKGCTNYNIVLEECDNNFNILDIKPQNQSVMKAAKIYNQNKDVQGLLAFLYKTED